MQEIIPGTNWFAELNPEVNIALTNEFGFAVFADCYGNPNVVATQANIYNTGCQMIRNDVLSGDNVYYNAGTLASPNWLNGSFFTGIAIGDTIIGGDPNDVLFVGPTGLLSQDDLFQWDSVDHQLQLGLATGFSGISQEILTLGGNVSNFFGSYIQNLSNGPAASGDYIVGADNDGIAFTGHFGDYGIQGSGFMPLSTGIIKNISIGNSGGTGYSINDVLTILGGDGTATVTVTNVGGGGVVTAISLTSNGTGYSVSNNNSTTGGGGTGCTLNITSLTDTTVWSANDIYLYGSGGNLIMGTDGGIPGKIIEFHTGGTGLGNIRLTISDVKTTLTTIDNTAQRGFFSQQISSDTSSSKLNLAKARGTTVSLTTVVTGDTLGNLAYWGYDGTNYLNMASITVVAEGTIGTNRTPTRMAFSTATNASPSVLTERMRIDSAGNVTIVSPGTATGSIVTVDGIQTLTSKRITKRVSALSANSATPAINTDTTDVVHITNQTAAITSFTTNLTGTPVDGDTLRISITGTASVALSFGASFASSGLVPLPTTTNSTNRLDIGFIWNTETSKWRCVAVS